MKRLIITISFPLSCFLIYAFLVEPNSLEVSVHQVDAPVRKPLKIAHLTDLHFRTTRKLEAKILESLEREKPDLIVITGDLLSESTNFQQLRNFLAQLRAPLGVFNVNGNWEHWTNVEQLHKIMEGTQVRDLTNNQVALREDIELDGYDDSLAGSPQRNITALEGAKRFRIALFHSPHFFDEISSQCDLALTGHTHGGQIAFPFWGPLWLPEGSGRYIKGWYTREASKMFVSRGIGTSILPIRFGARPELAIINIKNLQ